jgi:hypothetical protein
MHLPAVSEWSDFDDCRGAYLVALLSNRAYLFKRTWSSKITAMESNPSQSGTMVHLSNQSNAKESSDF